jgi:hypothetical protein
LKGNGVGAGSAGEESGEFHLGVESSGEIVDDVSGEIVDDGYVAEADGRHHHPNRKRGASKLNRKRASRKLRTNKSRL